ncbi:membrane protein [Cellvibrio zantedeschiae]|uniref:Membrane protein n=1 Tax=Cellvibrio zantedeschiae TaxID=1237077 RepID=A0ABQ3BB33_9GAMM|nr:DedA family protein [Cellvibrio zantedeschiae]GGY83861.1 membrane protein [Cellvibrio zantedeschiae]
MEFIQLVISFILHIDVHLSELFSQYGLWIYGILFLIIFCETGLVVTPFLPGDSLLFATGALVAISASSGLDINVMAAIVVTAAVLGNIVNYTIGRFFGAQLFRNPNSKVFRQDYLNKARDFYDKHGGVAIIMTRFIPIIRTFAPFVAGMSGMKYPKFIAYNIIGALLWVGIFLYLGYFFGNQPVVRKNFTLLIFGILVVSVLPIFYEAWKAHKAAKSPVK